MALIWVPTIIWALHRVTSSKNILPEKSAIKTQVVEDTSNEDRSTTGSQAVVQRSSRKVFIDLGTRNGDSTKMFLSKYPNASQFEIHMFECDPAFEEDLKKIQQGKNNIFYHRQAAWIEETDMTFGLAGGGSSLLQTQLNDKQSNFIVVKAIDFIAWLHSNFSMDDFLLVKMDIEGAEFKIISKLIETENYKLIDTLLLECHYYELTTLFPNIMKKDCDKLFVDLNKKGWQVINWSVDNEWSNKYGGFRDPLNA